MKIPQIILPTLLLLQACSHAHPGRWIASAPLTPPDLKQLEPAVGQVMGDILDENFGDSCVSYMQELEKRVDELDTRKLSRAELSEAGMRISQNLFGIRMVLHGNLDEYDQECILQLQSNFRQFRFLEDYLLELHRNVTHLTPADIKFQDEPVPHPDTNVSYYDFKTTFQDKEFKAGDLLISRGVSFLSAMIARLGKRATQFSHVVMISHDPKTKELKTIESYVGVGVSFYDMDYALKNENARILWLRAKDEKLAQKASEKMSQLVRDRLDAQNPIKYDYELNFNDPKTMSCAEVSQVAFEMASDGKFKIPQYPNEITGARSMIERLHLPEGVTYEPGDMEIDPRFELVGEFRDLRLTRDSRQKDAILTSLFEWMTHQDYELKDNLKSKMAGGIIYDVRRTFLWPLVKKLLKLDDFSKEIPRNMLKTVTLINQMGEGMLDDLKARDLAHEKKYGLPMSYMDFYRALEEMRVEDLKLYKNKKTKKLAKIHKFIRARK